MSALHCSFAPNPHFVSHSPTSPLRVLFPQVIQVERRGYYICDVPYMRASDPIRLLFVPDGKVRGSPSLPVCVCEFSSGCGRGVQCIESVLHVLHVSGVLSPSLGIWQNMMGVKR